ncbi:hypothetical protein ScPMuIL_015872 [Solemya velum]
MNFPQSSMSSLVMVLIIQRLDAHITCKPKQREITSILAEKQYAILADVKQSCYRRIRTEPYPSQGLFCNMTFDNLMCWPYTPAGQVARQRCPQYVNRLYKDGYASKQCMSNGEWYFHAGHNRTWTDYGNCAVPKNLNRTTEKHLGNIRLLYYIGYGVSLVSLLIAVSLMLFLRRLHCERNIIHVNFFISFILRCVICFVKDVDMNMVTVPVENGNWSTELVHKGDWKCKLLFSTFHYILGANYMWMFVEGLYLHTLIFVAVFQQKKMFKFYIFFGWCSPLVFVIPWVIVRLHLEDVLCWNTHDDDRYYWIMRGPILASIIINFIFFLNIIRVLFTKLMAHNTRDPNRYRKLGRSTLVLIPLFGVHYIVFVTIPDCLSDEGEVISVYLEMFCNSIQGFIVSILFCYINGEVRAELKKKWRHLCLWRKRSSSVRSRNASSISFYQNREKGSQSVMMTDLYRRDSVLSEQTAPIVDGQVSEMTETENKNEMDNGLLSQTNGKHNGAELNGGRYVNFDAIAEETEECSAMIAH